jgi:hypothetical protein
MFSHFNNLYINIQTLNKKNSSNNNDNTKSLFTFSQFESKNLFEVIDVACYEPDESFFFFLIFLYTVHNIYLFVISLLFILMLTVL